MKTPMILTPTLPDFEIRPEELLAQLPALAGFED
jgi:hypothetical protein